MKDLLESSPSLVISLHINKTGREHCLVGCDAEMCDISKYTVSYRSRLATAVATSNPSRWTVFSVSKVREYYKGI